MQILVCYINIGLEIIHWLVVGNKRLVERVPHDRILGRVSTADVYRTWILMTLLNYAGRTELCDIWAHVTSICMVRPEWGSCKSPTHKTNKRRQ